MENKFNVVKKLIEKTYGEKVYLKTNDTHYAYYIKISPQKNIFIREEIDNYKNWKIFKKEIDDFINSPICKLCVSDFGKDNIWCCDQCQNHLCNECEMTMFFDDDIKTLTCPFCRYVKPENTWRLDFLKENERAI